MGKTSICLEMLELLNTGSIYKISELADMLETNPRNIIEYKKELEEAGYYITSISGKYGGYKLDNTCLFPVLKLNDDEKQAIKDSYEYLLSKNDFLNKEIYQKAMSKIISSFRNEYEMKPLKVIEKGTVSITDKEVEEKYNLINSSIVRDSLITFNYLSNRNKIVERTVEPYKLYIYNSNWFLLGYSRELNDFRAFKLARMSELKSTNIKFSRDPFYKESDYFDEQGFKKNSDWYTIKLRVTGYPLLKLQEQRLGRNQNLVLESSNEGVLTVDMQYKTNIYSFVGGLGSSAEVLEPEWLRADMTKILSEMLKKYI